MKLTQKICAPSPIKKKEYISDIGKILIEENGKKKHYKPKEIKKAHKKSTWSDGLDFSCWAMSTYSAHEDFDKYHESIGEVCNYSEMKIEMLSGLSDSTIMDWSEIASIDIDSSWLDFGDAFDGVLEGIGDFVGGILDGL